MHDTDRILYRGYRSVVHVRISQHHVTKCRGFELMTIGFFLSHGIASVITVRQPCIPVIEIAVLDTHELVRLTTDIYTNVASSAFIVLE